MWAPIVFCHIEVLIRNQGRRTSSKHQLYPEEKESPIPPDLVLLSLELKAIVDYTSKFNISGTSGRKNLTIKQFTGWG